MSSSIHVDDKKKDILVLGRGPTQGLESTLTAEKMYSINFTMTKKTFCLSVHYNGANSYLFVNGTEMYKFKAKDSAIVYDFSADYNTITVDDIKHIHKYLMKKK